MGKSNWYGGAIWTNHAIQKMRDRGLSQDKALEAFSHPDKTFSGKRKDTTEFQKRIESYLITVVAARSKKSEWIIISAWMDPPLPGSKDYKEKEAYKRYQKASGFMKIVLTIKNQIGF